MAKRAKRRHPGKVAFLAAISTVPNISRAAKLADIDRDRHYIWLRDDPEYAIAFSEAWERGVSSVEAGVAQRAAGAILPQSGQSQRTEMANA